MKVYVIMVAEKFPKGHIIEGAQTNFDKQIREFEKIHTIRLNYELWKKRFEKIEANKACISLRHWMGKPYRSPQIEFFRLYKDDGIGLQKIVFDDAFNSCLVDEKRISLKDDKLFQNDGLYGRYFKSWFAKNLTTEPKALIHFTNFRY